ncbi:MAG: DUF3102 domain-containing protein [Rubrivivax sp.]|nr:DUF3102 domain-containing protein [Rubrivivax sp.]
MAAHLSVVSPASAPPERTFEQLAAEIDRLDSAFRESRKQAYIGIGRNLAEIKEQKKYGGRFVTFEQCCKARFGYSHRFALRMIEAAAVVDNLWPIGHDLSTAPATESTARPLAKLPDAEAQRAVWSMALEASDRPTARQVANLVRAYLPPPPAAKLVPQTELSKVLLVLDDMRRCARFMRVNLTHAQFFEFASAVAQEEVLLRVLIAPTTSPD